MRNKFRLILFLIPLAGVLCAYLIKKTEPLIIVDPLSGLDKKQFGIILQTDSLSGGTSVIKLLDDPYNRLAYQYSLNNKVNAPMVRLIIESKLKAFFDLSPYNQLSITLQSKNGKQIPIVICNATPYHSRADEVNSYHLAVNYALVSPKLKKQALQLDNFTTPDWWYTFASNKKWQNITPKVELVKYVFLTNSNFSKHFTEDTVLVSDMRFEYQFTSFYIRAAIIVLIYYLICLLFFYLPKFMWVEKVHLLYKKIDTTNYEDTDKKRIKTYLQQNFQNPELTITNVQEATGIHQRKISGIIKKDCEQSFKAYLNQLRIEKAKELLTGTDLSISSIAFECGYNNTTHFNRVFKTEQHVSPQEFRLSQKPTVL